MPANKSVNTFTTVTQAAKSAAREERLILATLRKEDKLFAENTSFASLSKSLTDRIAAAEKEAAIVEYEAAHTATDNPEFDDIQKDATETRKEVDARKAEYQKELDDATTEHDKVVAELNQKIADLQSGKLPVDHEAVVERAKELIKKTVEGQYLNGDFDGVTDVAA